MNRSLPLLAAVGFFVFSKIFEKSRLKKSKKPIIDFMKVNIYLGESKIENDKIKNYKCVSDVVKEAVNNVYYQYIGQLKKREDK